MTCTVLYEAAARLVEALIEPMSPQVAVDTGRMWRTEQTQAIAKALRARAAGQEEALQLLYNACPAAKPPNAALWEAFKKARAVLKEIEP